MNVPAIALKSFNESRNSPELTAIVNIVIAELNKLSTPELRTAYIHQKIDEYNEEVFNHPLVKKFSPCKMGCSACCHTQVSVTEDEAHVLAQKIHSGIMIDEERLQVQMDATDIEEDYYQLTYAERKCIFLDDQGSCLIYKDRPSVCRTNAVLGSAEQCDSTSRPGRMTLIRTPKADLVIYAAYLFSKESGTLPHMVGKNLVREDL
jgi:Fe-S-cluster containining protein